MVAKCIGTGSSGNCYSLIDKDGNILLLDCGLSIKDIKVGIDFQVSKLVGCLVTHSHSDHSKSVDDLKRMGVPVIAPYLGQVKDARLGSFFVKYFKLDDNEGRFCHSNADGSECEIFGYMIMHDKEPIKMLYITDCQFIKWRFRDINNVILGVDYADELVPDDNKAKQLHIYSGHLSIDTACDFIKATDSKHTLNNLIIGHMSDTASDRVLYLEKLKKATYCNIHFAQKGGIYELM